MTIKKSEAAAPLDPATRRRMRSKCPATYNDYDQNPIDISDS
jgi:hypothetical protein